MATTQSAFKHLSGVWGWVYRLVGAVAGAGPLLQLAEDLMQKQAEKLLRRLLCLTALYLTLVAGIIFITIGLIFTVIDITIVPRGFACALGGGVLVLVSAIWLQLGKK
ncbi:MAG: hypothetical protein HGA76_05925 [Candidatus Firestonebacteria bacterium]|nr:hypothetical protein [Candidatus Firestonebacteria bacterium]